MHADGTVTLFDNGSNPRVHYQSRALRLELDARAHRAELPGAYNRYALHTQMTTPR